MCGGGGLDISIGDAYRDGDKILEIVEIDVDTWDLILSNGARILDANIETKNLFDCRHKEEV